MNKKLKQSISFKHWPLTYWLYKAIRTINLFKQLKHGLELKFLNFKYFLNCQDLVSLPACLSTAITLLPKPLELWHNIIWYCYVQLGLFKATYSYNQWLWSHSMCQLTSLIMLTSKYLVYMFYTSCMVSVKDEKISS